MSISSYTEEDFASILHKGMLDGVRSRLKTLLMNSLEKEVDAAIDQTLSAAKGYVESFREYHNDRIVFNVIINGVRKDNVA